MSALIYQISGPENGVYVGSTTTSVQKRFNNHKHNARLTTVPGKLYVAMRAHGEDAFTVAIIEIVRVEDRLVAEGAAIRRLNAHVAGYNTCIPGRTKCERRRAWRASHPDLLRGQRQRRAARLAERRRALVVDAENEEH